MVVIDATDTIIRNIIDFVKKEMVGRIADENGNTFAMAKTTLIHGDHLEIGTLHGGSAIVVALVKREFGFTGKVTCIDPLNGYYIGTKYSHPVDWVSKVPVTIETVKKNMEIFGVELEIIQKKSIPFPIDLNRRFKTAYIDGDHENNVPMLDFLMVEKVTEKFITFDNVQAKYPDVIQAVSLAEKLWKKYKRENNYCIVEKE